MRISSLEDLNDLDFSYLEEKRSAGGDGESWKHDYRRELLGVDLPEIDTGQNGFERVKNLLLNYKFPNPDLIEGTFEDSGPLLGRNILLVAKFMGFKFRLGVRIVEVIDQIRELEGELYRCWGYSYRTLKGHFEQGQIRFEIQKKIPANETFFVIESHSRLGEISNPFYWAGMKIFGRSLQRKFVEDGFDSVRKAFNGEL